MTAQKNDGEKNRLDLVPADFIRVVNKAARERAGHYPYHRWDLIANVKAWAEHDPNVSIDDIALRIAGEIGRPRLAAEGFAEDWLLGLGRVMTFGAVKYAAWNWAGGFTWSRLVGAMIRHLHSDGIGDGLNEETGFPHLWHALFCAMALYVHELRGLGTDDRHQWEGEMPVRCGTFDVPIGVVVDGEIVTAGQATVDLTSLPPGLAVGRETEPDEPLQRDFDPAGDYADPHDPCTYCGGHGGVHRTTCARPEPMILVGPCEPGTKVSEAALDSATGVVLNVIAKSCGERRWTAEPDNTLRENVRIKLKALGLLVP